MVIIGHNPQTILSVSLLWSRLFLRRSRPALAKILCVLLFPCSWVHQPHVPSPLATQAVACLTLGRTALPVANVISVTMAATRLRLKLDCLSSDDVKRWSPPHHPAVVATTAPQRDRSVQRRREGGGAEGSGDVCSAAACLVSTTPCCSCQTCQRRSHLLKRYGSTTAQPTLSSVLVVVPYPESGIASKDMLLLFFWGEGLLRSGTCTGTCFLVLAQHPRDSIGHCSNTGNPVLFWDSSWHSNLGTVLQ